MVLFSHSGVAQLAERLTVTERVAGSNPAATVPLVVPSSQNAKAKEFNIVVECLGDLGLSR